MYPPARPPSPAENGAHWTDDQIILLLEEHSRGSRLPDNVVEDSNPYQYPPAYLPEGIWYLVRSNEKKDSVFGFWKAKGEACKVYSNSVTSGWKTTLEYFEGTSPHGQRTDWLMQDYKITQAELPDKNNTKDPISLCRVFLCSRHDSTTEIKQSGSIASNIPNANITSCQDLTSESKEREVGLLPVADDSVGVFSEQECFLTGDYLELNDLVDPLSHSSSSQNSSCPSNTSDEYFDSLALLRDLEEDENNYLEKKQLSSRYSFTTSVEPENVVMNPAASAGSPLNGSSPSIDGSLPTGLIVQEPLTDGRVVERSTKRHNPESSRNEGTSDSSNMAEPSASPRNATPTREKKAGSGRMKRIKIYFCLASF